MSRTAVLGGTFDPIHNGHLGLARVVADHYGLDRVVFMPAGNPSLKQDANVAPVEHRVAMVRLACQTDTRFVLDEREVSRPGVTYTADTLAELAQELPGEELLFIIGGDCAQNIMKWYRADEVARLCRVVAVARPGYDFSEARRAHEESAIRFDIDFVEADTPDVSSTLIRQRIATGKPVDDLLPLAVAAYIHDKGLYGSRGVVTDCYLG